MDCEDVTELEEGGTVEVMRNRKKKKNKNTWNSDSETEKSETEKSGSEGSSVEEARRRVAKWQWMMWWQRPVTEEVTREKMLEHISKMLLKGFSLAENEEG